MPDLNALGQLCHDCIVATTTAVAPHISHLAAAGTTLASAGGGAVSSLAAAGGSLAAAGGDAVSTLAAAGGDAVSTLAPAINTAARNLPTVLAHEAELPRVFVHLSAFAGIRGMMSSNMIVLRALALLSSSAALAFNMWNGLRSPAFWNLAFIAVNLRRLTQLVLAEQTCITLDADEQKLYESAFAPYGVTLRDFSTLLREASSQWREFEANEVILKEGDPMPLLYYVVDGEVEVLFNEGTRVTNVLTPGKNGWLGELWDPNQDPAYWERPHHWMAGFRSKKHSLLVAFDRKALHDVIARSHPLRDAASAAEVSDLWGKLRGCARQSVLNSYAAMKEMASLHGAPDAAQLKTLESFAARHKLSEAQLKQEADRASKPTVLTAT